MRQILMCMLVLTASSLLAQENVSFEKVIKVDSTKKAIIFATVNDWFASTYNSANDVIQMSDKEEGIIIGNGSMNYNYGKMSYSCYTGYIKYTIKVYVKDNRYKVVLTNFSHSVKAGNGQQCSLGMITSKELYATSGMSKKYHNNVWKDIKAKTESYSNEIRLSLKKKTSEKKSEKVSDDW
jgi:hypothetical protein